MKTMKGTREGDAKQKEENKTITKNIQLSVKVPIIVPDTHRNSKSISIQSELEISTITSPSNKSKFKSKIQLLRSIILFLGFDSLNTTLINFIKSYKQ